MPRITVNFTSIEHNHRTMARLSSSHSFTFMPVLKIMACWPPLLKLMITLGYEQVAASDVDELAAVYDFAPEQAVLINLFPAEKAADVVQRFGRSAIGSIECLRALEDAATVANRKHSVVIMLDLGDGREGMLPHELPCFLEQAARLGLNYVTIEGLGVTMGCLRGVYPDSENMSAMRTAITLAERGLGRPLSIISLGGSVFLDWFCQHSRFPHAPPGCRMELRAGDPLFLGYDMYRNVPFAEGDFRTDVFSLEASVLEVREKITATCGSSASNSAKATQKRRRALLDCGALHTVVEDLELAIPKATLTDFTGNYSIVDITDCDAPLRLGDRVVFRPGYWAVARAFRTPTVQKCWSGSRDLLL